MITIKQLTNIVRDASNLMTVDEFEIMQKRGCENIVTTSDLAVQNFLCNKLSEIMPKSGFLCEEKDINDIKHEYTWIIDPIDGTANYSRGFNQCAICVGLKHHDEMEMNTLLAPIVQVCDAISGARPGARREIVEAYIKRLNDLEAIAMSYPGVTKTYAIQAGRELRVIVGADKMDDKETELLSGEIATKIQNEMTYPGQVKITVIRETRSVAYAK